MSTPTTFFTHSDHLGTERVQTAVNGSSCETITNTAFGDGMNETGSCDPTALRFTDKLRDYETNLDDFGARFYSSQLGRFMSTDWSAVPAPVPYANLNNPQTLNLYAIVADNPETFADLDGHCQDGDTAQSACATPFGANAGAFGEPAPNVAPDQKTGTGTGQSTTQWSLAWQAKASLNFLGEELKGVADATITPIVSAAEHPVDTAEGIANAVAHPVQTTESVAKGTVDTLKAVANGDPRAIGQVAGAVIAAAVGEKAVQEAKGLKVVVNRVRAGDRAGEIQHIGIVKGQPHSHRKRRRRLASRSRSGRRSVRCRGKNPYPDSTLTSLWNDED